MKKLLLMATALLFACTADLFAQKEVLSWVGDGSASNPYEVSSAAHFRAINERGLNQYYKQTRDIVIEGTIEADSSNAFIVRNFTGNYDGNGKSITFHMNVNIWNRCPRQYPSNKKVFVGLFDTLSGNGVIKNLKITNSSIRLYREGDSDIVPGMLDWHAGLLCGKMDGANARIANCMITDSWIDAHDLAAKMANYSYMHVGGVVGYMNRGTLHEVAFINTNTNTDPNTPTPEYSLDGLACVGGIVAKIDGSPVTIEDCLFRGSLRVQRSENEGFGVATVGGIVGRVHSTSTLSRISNCYVDASKIVSINSEFNQAAAAGIAVSAIPFDVYHCYADVDSISAYVAENNTNTWYPITGRTQNDNTETTKCEYSGATVRKDGVTKYYSVGYRAQAPTKDNTTTQEPDALWYLGDAFIQVCEPIGEQQEQVCKIQLKSTIKGYIYSDKDGDFNTLATWQNYPDSWGNGISLFPNDARWDEVLGIEIKHKVTLNDQFSHTFGAIPIKIIDNNGRASLIVEQEGVFANATVKVEEGGSFVNTTSSNVRGVIEKRLHGEIWNFIGLSGYDNLAPLRNRLLRENQSENTGNTENEILKFWALGYDYQNSRWNEDNYLYWEDNIATGAGILVYTNGDNILVEIGQNRDNQGNATDLNNFENDQTVSHTFQNSGPWVALANPYPAVMDARKLMNEIGTQNIQGRGIYVREAKSYDWTFVTTEENNKQINAAQGFFVKFSDEQEQDRTIKLSKTMLVDYPTTENNTSKVAASGAGEFLKVSVASEGYRVPVMYRQNDAASAEYDIFDADKLFGSGTVVEPYFALGERMLCKQEADSTHFVADLNIRSEQCRSVEIIAEYIPEGYTLSLIDDNNETEMNQDDVYTADIARGDN
ncbi:MAG: hypothetical protein KIG54_02235, partial [Bacteroidales bacterium]|nr:hypothetical protein [Bacteroidales bacterium]